jgi:hypothetical protein
MDRGIDMALVHINATVRTTPQPIATLPLTMGQGRAVQIYNGHSSSIFIGDATIATSGATIGRTIAAGGSFQLWLSGGDVIYAISAANTAAGAVVVTYSA